MAEERYRNKTSVPQVFYVRGVKYEIVPSGTIVMGEKDARSLLHVLEKVPVQKPRGKEVELEDTKG